MPHRERPDALWDQLLLDALRRGQTVRLRASSGSMIPVIWPGDLLLARDEPPLPGDIVVYRQGNAFYSHWLCGLCGNEVQVKSQGGRAESIDAVHVVARVTAIRPTWRSWLRRWLLSRASDVSCVAAADETPPTP